MMKRALALAIAATLSLPPLVSGQEFAVAGRAGSLGLGAEAAMGLGGRLTLRGGIGLTPIEINATNLVEVGEEVDATLTLPKTWYNIGADLHLGSGFRIGGGMLFKTDDPTLEAKLASGGTIEIGGVEYSASDVSSATAILDSKDQAPYAIIGFGSPRGSGIGLYFDLGVALLGDPRVSLSATGNPSLIQSNDFQSRLRQEEQRIEERAGSYLKLWPILNLGVRIGL